MTSVKTIVLDVSFKITIGWMVLQVEALSWDSDLECCLVVTWLSGVVL